VTRLWTYDKLCNSSTLHLILAKRPRSDPSSQEIFNHLPSGTKLGGRDSQYHQRTGKFSKGFLKTHTRVLHVKVRCLNLHWLPCRTASALAIKTLGTIFWDSRFIQLFQLLIIRRWGTKQVWNNRLRRTFPTITGVSHLPVPPLLQ